MYNVEVSLYILLLLSNGYKDLNNDLNFKRHGKKINSFKTKNKEE